VFPPLRLREAFTLGGLTVKELIARVYREMNEHEIMTRASAVGFYAMLAFVPFLGVVLLIVVQLLPDVTGATGAAGIGNLTVAQLEQILKAFFPEEVYNLVVEQIGRIQQAPPVGLLSIGLIITIWSASTLYTVIIDSLNRIEGVTETRSFLKVRVVATLMMVIEAVILVGSLILIVAWPMILRRMGLSAPAAALATAVQWTVLFVMVLLSFALTFYVGPDAEKRWEWISPGSLVGSIGFLVTSFGFRFYIEKFTHYDKAYGSLGGVMVLLFWFWLSSLILLVAAQMNKVIEDASPLGKSYGQKVDPTRKPDLEHAEPVTVAESEAKKVETRTM
jgi:membrane protein